MALSMAAKMSKERRGSKWQSSEDQWSITGEEESACCAARRSGGLEVWRSGGLEVWRSGGLEVWKSGGLEVWRFSNNFRPSD